MQELTKEEPTEQLIPLHIAAEHFAAAATRGEAAGRRKERNYIYDILKKKGQYQALLVLRAAEIEDSAK